MTSRILYVDFENDSGRSPWVAGLLDAGFQLTDILNAESPIDLYEEQQPDAAVIGPSKDPRVSMECLHKIKIPFPNLPVFSICDDRELFSTADCGPFNRVDCLSSESSPSTLSELLTKMLGREPSTAAQNGLYPIIVGYSPGIREIRRKIRTVAEKDVAVLITGESGTGKELIARAIHCHSLRKNAPLVKISCGALPDELLESEVFGYQQGAFTGAHENKPGRLELAHQGTLFMDEIGDLPLPMQVKFLQVLEEKAFFRLGGTEDKIVDTRVVAATNADLLRRVYDHSFRKDLYYRLSVIHIKAPPLRQRKEDIPLLTHYFLNKYCFELRRPVLEVNRNVLEHLSTYNWPGNVRELENVVRRAVVMNGWDFVFDELINSESLPSDSVSENEGAEEDLIGWSKDQIREHLSLEGASLKTIVREYTAQREKEAILKALEIARWNRKQAARLLEVSYKTVLNRISDFDLTQ